MTIEAILKHKGTDVLTIDPATSVKVAADIMREKNIAALMVVQDVTILGIITERDIVRAFARFGDALGGKLVEDIMTRNLIATEVDDSVKHVMAVMTNRRVRHLPVLRGGELAGIVSIGDVVRHRLHDLELETNVLRDVYIAAR